MSFALPVLSLPLHRHPLNAQAALAKIDMPACRQAGARKIARVILERRHLFVVNFRVFAGARIRKFSAKVHQDLRRVGAGLPRYRLLAETRSKPQCTAKIFSARKHKTIKLSQSGKTTGTFGRRTLGILKSYFEEFLRDSRRKIHEFAGARMVKPQVFGVQRQARKCIIPAVFSIAQNRMTQKSQMHPDLMGPAGERL